MANFQSVCRVIASLRRKYGKIKGDGKKRQNDRFRPYAKNHFIQFYDAEMYEAFIFVNI